MFCGRKNIHFQNEIQTVLQEQEGKIKLAIKVKYRINPPIRRFDYKTGAVFGPFPGRILLLLNYKTG